METIDLNAFMHRVDEAHTATELIDLQFEFRRICNDLSSDEAQLLVRAYTERLKARGRDISGRLTQMETERVTG